MRTSFKTTAKPPRMYSDADMRLLPLIWTDCAWKPEVTFTRSMLVLDHVPACRIAINAGNNAMKHKKPSTHRRGTMKALIIYDDVDSAERAIGILRRAASQARVHGQWDIKPWRVGVLRLPIAAEKALLEAADADAIVFADLRGSRLPTWLKDWLMRWGVRRQPGEPALVVTCAGPPNQPCGVSYELLRFAAQNKLDLIIQANPSLATNC